MSKGIPVIGRDPNGKAKIVNVDEHGNLKVAQSGNIVEVYGSTLGERPDYTMISEPTIFVLMPQLNMWYTDGTVDWVVI
jgi:hypothetical protein